MQYTQERNQKTRGLTGAWDSQMFKLAKVSFSDRKFAIEISSVVIHSYLS